MRLHENLQPGRRSNACRFYLIGDQKRPKREGHSIGESACIVLVALYASDMSRVLLISSTVYENMSTRIVYFVSVILIHTPNVDSRVLRENERVSNAMDSDR